MKMFFKKKSQEDTQASAAMQYKKARWSPKNKIQLNGGILLLFAGIMILISVCVSFFVASRIYSAKLKEHTANKIVFDVTVGKGAFLKTREEAQRFIEQMVRIGKLAGRDVRCVMTPMDEPLGYAIGNSLEVVEAINFLKGDMPKDLKEVVLELGASMLQLAGKGNNIDENKLKMLEYIENGSAYNKFKEMVENQGGDISYLEDTTKFKKAEYISAVVTEKDFDKIDVLECLL